MIAEFQRTEFDMTVILEMESNCFVAKYKVWYGKPKRQQVFKSLFQIF